MRSRIVVVFVVALAMLSGARTVGAGEVRVNVSNFAFSPADIGVNLGDHVVWIWTGGTHTATSGDAFGDLYGPVPDGIFESGSRGPGGEYGWKANVAGTEPYYCLLHWASYMVGTVDVIGIGYPVSDFRITEVQYNVAGGKDLIEIANLGTDAGDLGRYRLSVTPGASSSIGPISVPVPPGGRVVLRVNQAGVDSPTQIFLPSLPDLPATGALTLYVPFTPPGAALDAADQVVDFVQWGAGGGPHEAAAVSAGTWTAGQYVPPVGDGRSMEFCGTSGQRGASLWAEVSVPNFGVAGGCATPTVRTTWGRVKTLYR